MYTRDDGANWTVLTPARSYINGVVSDNRGRFVAVGANGTIIRSSDGGASWEPMASGSEEILQSVAWDDAGLFVAVGGNGTILSSSDGGDTWQAGNSGTTDALLSVATDREGTWVAGGPQGLIVYSHDGATTWAIASTGMGGHVNGLTYVADGRWVAVGLLGKAAYSTDGGRTWTVSNAPTRKTLEAVASDGANVVAVGWDGAVVRSQDGGETWTAGESGTTQRLRGLALGRDGALVAVGWRGTAALSNDGGASWTVQENLTRKILEEVAYNRLPDLAVSSPRLDAECHVVVAVTNQGPAALPADVWDNASLLLRMSLGEEPSDSITMVALDPERALATASGQQVHTFVSQSVADTVAVAVTIDSNGVVAEAREGNNTSQATLVCER
jgi:photosystem II stability/assembly factor-like uncharacterized protein